MYCFIHCDFRLCAWFLVDFFVCHVHNEHVFHKTVIWPKLHFAANLFRSFQNWRKEFTSSCFRDKNSNLSRVSFLDFSKQSLQFFKRSGRVTVAMLVAGNLSAIVLLLVILTPGTIRLLLFSCGYFIEVAREAFFFSSRFSQFRYGYIVLSQ